MEKGRIVIITGAPGTGKTTTASMAAKESSLEKSVHMHTDDFYHYLCKGAIPPHLPESNEQNLIVIEAFLEAAKRYVRGGYDVIVDGIIGPWFLEPWLKAVQDGYEVHYIILRAHKEETMKRAVGRAKLDRKTNMELVEIMWEQFNNLGCYESYVMDITDCSVEETVSMIKTEVERKTRLLFKRRNRKMLPTIEEAEQLLQEAEKCNPGPWGNHSRVAAHCAQKIAAQCDDLEPDKAYILGLLHDIGRKFGVRHLGHVSDGYSYMMSLGYDEAAKICLTHSFNNQRIDEYIGKFDTTDEELKMIQKAMKEVTMDEYDKLIQLCDSIAGSEGVLDIEARMADVKRRYGSYPQEKWNSNLALKKHFEEKMGKDLYIVVEKDEMNLIVGGRHMEYKENALHYEDYYNLRDSVNWQHFSEEQTQNALSNSLYTVTAVENNQTVGMGRLIGDGMYYIIADIVVCPAFQRNGVGTEIVNMLIEYVKNKTPANGRSSIMLTAEKGKERFYERLGFKQIPHEFCGSGMRRIIRK